MQNLEQAIRERAYHLWVADGCRDGAADAYWLSAQRELLTASVSGSGTEASAASPVADPVAKKAPAKAKAAKAKVAKAEIAKVPAPAKSKRRAA
jgi:hypothetical protein